jgi:hypothetical protein
MSRTVRWTVCWLAVLGLVGMAGCQKGKSAKAVAAEKEEEGWNPRGAYKPPPPQPEAPKRGGIQGDMDMASGAGMAVRAGLERNKAKGIMENIGLFYHMYNTQNGRSPANQEEFLASLGPDGTHVADAIKAGYIVVVWKSPLSSNTVLAYEKDGYQGGRLVMRGDKSMKVMTEAEFQAALRGQ